MTCTLLMTSTGGVYSAQTILCAKASRRHDIHVVAVNADGSAQARHFADAFEVVPLGNEPGYVDRICDVIKAHGVDLVLPCSDEEALVLASSRQQVEGAGATLACTDIETLRIFSDKKKTYAALQQAGIPVPDWACVTSRDEFETAFTDLLARHGEVAVRPAVSRGGRNVFVIRQDIQDIESYLGGFELHMNLETFRRDHLDAALECLPLILAERLMTPAFDSDILAWCGKAIHVIPRQRIDHTGNSQGYEIFEQKMITETGHKIAELFKLSWLYDVDWMTNKAGEPRIVEINPRPSGSFTVPIIAGVPLLDDMISLFRGEDVKPADPPQDQTIIPFNALKAV